MANLSQLWVVFDAHESDLPWIQEGDELRFTVALLPEQTFTSEVTFIDPVIDPRMRVAQVRTEIKLKKMVIFRQTTAHSFVTQSECPHEKSNL